MELAFFYGDSEMAGTISLADVIGQAAATNAQQTGYAQQQAAQYGEAASQQRVIADNAEKAGELEAQATLTKLQGELNTQNARVKVANSFGTNVNDVSDVVTSLATEYRNNSLALIDAQNQVADLEANNDLFTNPMGFLKDLVLGESIRDKRDALVGKVDTQAKVLQNLNALTQTGVQTQNAISETLTQTSIAQVSELSRIKAAQQAAQAKTEAAKYGAASIEALQQVGAANFNRNMAAYNAVQENERMAMARKEHALRLKALNEADAELDDTLANINAYEKQFGRPETTKMMLKKYFGSQGELGNYLRDADLGGFKIRQGAISGVLGATPADVFSNVQTQGLDLPPSFKPSVDLISSAYNTLQTARSNAAKSPMGIDEATQLSKKDFEKPETAKAAFNGLVGRLAQGYQSRIQTGKGNPYEAPPISSVLQSPTAGAQQLARSNFGKTVLANLKTAGMEQPTPQLMISTALTSVADGSITMSEARDGITAFYTEANGLNNTAGGFTALGVPTMESYIVRADDIVGGSVQKAADFSTAPFSFAAQSAKSAILPFAAGGFLSSTKLVPQINFDLTKPTDVTTALTMMNSAKMRDRILNQTGALSQ